MLMGYDDYHAPAVMPAPGQSFAGPAADPAERARRLSQADATIMLGPRLAQNGREWRVPSPAPVPQAVARWKALGGRFQDEGGLTPYWFVPRRAIGLADLDALYRRFYPISIRDAAMRLVMSNHAMHDQIKKIVALRQMQRKTR
jgi:hypothetical protein